MSREDVRRRALYLALYAERFGRIPRSTPEFVETER